MGAIRSTFERMTILKCRRRTAARNARLAGTDAQRETACNALKSIEDSIESTRAELLPYIMTITRPTPRAILIDYYINGLSMGAMMDKWHYTERNIYRILKTEIERMEENHG